MADLNRVAKRMYNVHPHAMHLVVDGGLEGTFTLRSAEFFQTEFQAEGTREGDDATYRFATSADGESVVVGRKGPDDDGWTMVGEVVEVSRLDD